MLDEYDEVPYPNLPHRHTRPEWLELVGRLYGVTPPPAPTARVLEIGCAVGGNVLPMAERNPDARFVALDINESQIAQARATAEAAGVRNVELRAMDLCDIGPELGEFDYIIAHGVYSWVPPRVQARLLDVCAERLAPTGIALISHNIKPGWIARGAARDMMLYHTREQGTSAERATQARTLLSFLFESSRPHDRLYKAQLGSIIEELNTISDDLLFHDLLSGVNSACYFHEIADELHARGLEYLADADLPSMFPNAFSPDVLRALEALGPDVIRREQYLDFLKNRVFRTTLIVRSSQEVRRRLSGAQAFEARMSSRAEVVEGGDLDDESPVSFRVRNAAATVARSQAKRMLARMAASWPASLTFDELDVGELSQGLAHDLLRLIGCGIIELSRYPDPFVVHAPVAPRATPLARLQAQRGERVTSMRHERTELSDEERRLLAELDGRPRASDPILESLARKALIF